MELYLEQLPQQLVNGLTLGGVYALIAIGVRQTKELGIDAVFFGSEGARDKKDYIQAAEGAADGS
ncbi:MAG: hypothetical protein P8X90_28150, partial [Desulfobacterales bacterium]